VGNIFRSLDLTMGVPNTVVIQDSHVSFLIDLGFLQPDGTILDIHVNQ